MLGLKNITVDLLTGYPVIVALALIVLLGLAVWLYIRTNPPLPAWLRGILMALRIIAVLALVLALFEPVIGYQRSFERQKRSIGHSRPVRVDAAGRTAKEPSGTN